MFLQTAFNRNEQQAMTEYCSVEKVVELAENEFNLLKNNTMESMSFIAEHAEMMHKDETGISRCVLFLHQNHDEGIIVNSEGTSYAKNFSYLPKARTLLLADESFTLQQFMKSMLSIRNDIVAKAIDDQDEGVFRIDLDEIHKFYKPRYLFPPLLHEMFRDRIEVDTIEFDDEEFIIRLSEEYAIHEEDVPYRGLTKEDVDVMVAKHLLWLNDYNGGEQLDLSGCYIANYDFSEKKLNGAIMSNAKFSNCSFMEAETCFVEADNSIFVDCNMIRTTGEEMSFKGAKFKRCNFFMAMMTHSNFSNALFSRSTIGGASMTNSCFENAKWIHTSKEKSNMHNASTNEYDWSNEEIGMKM